MRSKVLIVVCGAIGLFSFGIYLFTTSPSHTSADAQPQEEPSAGALAQRDKSITVQVVEPAETFKEKRSDRAEIAGSLQWIIVNPSYKDGLLSVAIKTSEEWDILLGEWDASKCLELRLTYTHPSPRVRVAVSDYLARHGPFRLDGEIASITVRNKENRDHKGFGVTVQMTSGERFSASTALAGAVIIELFYD